MRTSTTSVLSTSLVSLTLILAALPFGPIFWVNLLGITLNAYELTYLFMLAVLAAMNIRRPPVISIFGFFFILSIIYGSASILVYHLGIIQPAAHLRFYLPFVISTLILRTKIQFSARLFISLILICGAISAATALYIHHFAQEILLSAYAANAETISISEWGRLAWGNSTLVFFVLLSALVRELSVHKALLLIVGAITLMATLNTVSRSTALFLVFMMLAAVAFTSSKNWILRLGLTFTILVFAYVMAGSLIEFDPRLEGLFKSRFFVGDVGASGTPSIYDEDLVVNRFPLYAQYIDSLFSHYFMGQGLGIPLSTSETGTPVFVTDISFIAFVIPFGIAGAVVFALFIRRLFTMAGFPIATLSADSRRVIKIMIVTFILMSLNVDIFSRSNMVVFLCILLQILVSEETQTRRRFSLFNP